MAFQECYLSELEKISNGVSGHPIPYDERGVRRVIAQGMADARSDMKKAGRRKTLLSLMALVPLLAMEQMRSKKTSKKTGYLSARANRQMAMATQGRRPDRHRRRRFR